MLQVARVLSCSETLNPGPRHNLVHTSKIAKVPDTIWAGWNVREEAAQTGNFAD